MNYYPIFLDLRGRPCLVVGGGEVATGKIEELLKAEANVTVISPKVTQCIQRYADLGGLRHLPRPYRAGDIKGYFLAYAATGVAEIDVLMAGEASLQGVLLNVVNRPVLCSFVTPSVGQLGKLSIAISTRGKVSGNCETGEAKDYGIHSSGTGQCPGDGRSSAARASAPAV